MKLKDRLHQFGIAFDQLVNTLFAGYADETLSARCYRNNHKKWWGRFEKLVNLIFFWQRINGHLAHCELAFNSEMERKHLPKEYNNKE